MQSVHPAISLFSRIFQAQRGFGITAIESSLMNDVESEKVYAICLEIKERLDRGCPLVDPQIVYRVCEVIGVVCTRDFFLLRVIMASLESYKQKQYDLSVLVTDLMEPLARIREIEGQKVRVDVSGIPCSIMMCDECEKRSAVVKCEHCLDRFCQGCFDELHATGNRRSHFVQEIEQLVCISCDAVVADCQCVQCGSFFCSSCFVSIHQSRLDLMKHLKRNISGLICYECEHAHATVICEDCSDLFCSPCFEQLHRKGQRNKHSHLTVDPNGQVYRGGLLVSPSEAQASIARTRSQSTYSPWISFVNIDGSEYWHNFGTGEESNEPPSSF